jgi:hypothetical protein
MAEQRHPTLSELGSECDIILDNLYTGKTKKAEILKKQQAYLNKETPEQYKARKEQQAQRAVKKETPEEYAQRIDYMKRKEKVELEVETQRLLDKAEKQHKIHQDYLRKQADQAEELEKYLAYINSDKGRKDAEFDRNWNTREAIDLRKEQTANYIRYTKMLKEQNRSSGGSRGRGGSGGGSGISTDCCDGCDNELSDAMFGSVEGN